MGLSDRAERVTVTLTVDDWAVIVQSIGTATIPVQTRYRINEEIFLAAALTPRVLS